MRIFKILLLLFMILVVIGSVWSFRNGTFSIFDSEDISQGFDTFVSLEGGDEYVIAKFSTKEELTRTQYNPIFGLPVGDTQVTLSLVANYKYYVKLGELTQNLEGDTLFINAPELYLSTPVAFEFSSVREKGEVSAFGPDPQKMLNKLKRDASTELAFKGRLHTSIAYDKAAKALAENFNNYFKANGMQSYYKSIAVSFSSEKEQTIRRFLFSKGRAWSKALGNK